MVWNVVLELVVLTLLYGALVVGLVWLLRRVGVPARWAMVLGFLGFGLVTALAGAWLWPFDSSVYPNVWATLLGDCLYGWSADHLGDLWLLRVPQVYVVAAILLYGGLGLLCQWIYSHRLSDAGLSVGE
jgi:hypothetical protein